MSLDCQTEFVELFFPFFYLVFKSISFILKVFVELFFPFFYLVFKSISFILKVFLKNLLVCAS